MTVGQPPTLTLPYMQKSCTTGSRNGLPYSYLSEGWLPDTSLSLENNFQLNAPVVIRAKVILVKLISKLKLVIRQPSPSFMQPHAWNVWFTKNFIPDLTETHFSRL